MNKLINKISKWFKANWHDFLEGVCIGIGIVTICVFLMLSLLTISNGISDKRKAELAFRTEILEGIRSIQREIAIQNTNKLTEQIYSTLNHIENDLDILNSTSKSSDYNIARLYAPMTHIAEIGDTLYSSYKYLPPKIDRSPSSLIEPVNKTSVDVDSTIIALQSKLLQYQDTVNTYKGIIDDRTVENGVLEVGYNKQVRRKHIFQGIGLGELVYIGLRSARVF